MSSIRIVFAVLAIAFLLFPHLSLAQQQQDWMRAIGNILSSMHDTSGSIEPGAQPAPSKPAPMLSTQEISGGLREALKVGTERVVAQLSRTNGFNLDPAIHIPLPGTLKQAAAILNRVGMGGVANELELRINRAAEVATGKAKKLFVDAIKQMTISDAKRIFYGPDDAATQYLRRTMGWQLTKEIRPVVRDSLASTSAVKTYNSMMAQYSTIPMVPDVKANLETYATEKTMDGIFYYVAKEEAAIRRDPAKRTTEILKKVFTSQ